MLYSRVTKSWPSMANDKEDYLLQSLVSIILHNRYSIEQIFLLTWHGQPSLGGHIRHYREGSTSWVSFSTDMVMCSKKLPLVSLFNIRAWSSHTALRHNLINQVTF